MSKTKKNAKVYWGKHGSMEEKSHTEAKEHTWLQSRGRAGFPKTSERKKK